LSEQAISFGVLEVKDLPTTRTLRLHNEGNTPMTLESATATGAFAINSTCEPTLAAGANCAYSIQFDATERGAYTGEVVLKTSSGDFTVPLDGVAIAPLARLSPQEFDFGVHEAANLPVTQTFTLHNDGDAPMEVGSVTTTGPYTSDSSC